MIKFSEKKSVPKEISQKYIDFYFNDLQSKGINTTEEGYKYFYELIPRICEELSYGDLDFDKVNMYICTEPLGRHNETLIHLSRKLGDHAANAEKFIDYLCNMIFEGEELQVTNLDFYKLMSRVKNLEQKMQAIEMLLR